MAFWFINFFAVCILSSAIGLSLPPPTQHNGYNYGNYNSAPLPVRKPTIQLPLELNVNFTFPENGLPPMKINLGNVAEYLTERPGIPSSPKRTVLVNIKNPNRPIRPIPSDIYAAGLPTGSLIPGDVIQPCRSFIVSKCSELCSTSVDTCRSLCDGRTDCLSSCKTGFDSCKKFCNSTFSNIQAGDIETPSKIYLPKCLRNCRGSAACNDQCHHVCHFMLDKKPTISTNNNATPFVPALPVAPYVMNSVRQENYDSIKEGDFSDDNDQDQDQ